MKKFKSTLAREAESEREQLSHFLDQRNLVKSVFWDYCRLPWGIALSLLMWLSACLIHGQWWQRDYLLFVFAGLAYVSGLSTFNYWQTYWNKPILLRYKQNTFIASGKIPALLLGLSIFIVWPLGWSVMLFALWLTSLAVLYTRPLQVNQPAWRESIGKRAFLTGLIWTGLTALPVLGATELKHLTPFILVGVVGLAGVWIGHQWRWV